MNIFLANRGSQGDIYPYLRLAQELTVRGHFVTISIPRIFEKQAKEAGVNYVLQAMDDIAGMLSETPDTKALLKWMHGVVEDQFDEYIPLLEKHDIFVCGNTEFSAGSIAEYCKKPIIRTAFGPFLPSKTISPPAMPFPTAKRIFIPLLWAMLNGGLNMMILKTINRRRKALELKTIRSQTSHAPKTADNFLMYSKYLGNVDTEWPYKWNIGGYVFNDSFPYEEQALKDVSAFIKKDARPTIFFTLGSCNAEERDRFAERLFDICCRHSFKLVVGCGWWKVGTHLHNKENLYLLDKAIPHWFIFPSCDAIIHHGGAGTTHSVARAGKPQMVVPLLIDQFYWGQRVKELGIGPGSVKMKTSIKPASAGKASSLEEKVLDLVNNPVYKENAARLGEQIRSEKGLEEICKHIESYASSLVSNSELAVNQ
ncbi:MAG: glycosyltransferase [Treponema sp.]|jgi:UDP:flavonoid glycosyltransferase YjiC (YdhE family)|nr:glycosyltransferase [Treponema sp.]